MRFFILTKIWLIFLIPFFFIVFVPAFGEPSIVDPNYSIEQVVTGLSFPVQMEFIGNDILVIQKNDGKVLLIRDGELQDSPALQLDVESRGLEGLLGLEVVDSNVYLYVTQLTKNEESEVNRVYQYHWNGEKLVNEKLINELPGNPTGHDHVGGVLTSDNEKNVYAIIGDLFRRGFLQNNDNGEIDDSSIILRVGLDESVLRPHTAENPLEHYYAVGIRNSFGLTFDHVTGNMWQTENGPEDFDEINLVMPNFNSGWSKIMGPADENDFDNLVGIDGFTYSDPEFSWKTPVAPAQLLFPSSKNFEDYNDRLFVAGVMTGMIYQFQLNPTRTGFIFENSDLNDLVLDDGDSTNEIIFGTGFNGIVDLDMGPDGNLYGLTIFEGGSIFKILPTDNITKNQSPKKQIDLGILSENIECKKGLVLIMKSSSSEIVCVYPNTVTKIVERNWGMFSNLPISNHCNKPGVPNIDWSGCNFSFANLKGINLEGANLEKINLVGADLSGAHLQKSRLSNADLTLANLTEADLSGSKINVSRLTQSILFRANISESDLTSSAMTNSDLREANLSRSILKNAYLDFADVTNSNIIESDLSNASMSNIHGASVNFSHSNLSGVDLSESFLGHAYFLEANLFNADLSNSYLFGARFQSTIMTDADLSGSNLEKADFHMASLNNTNFSSCLNHEFCN